MQFYLFSLNFLFQVQFTALLLRKNGILLPKLFRPTVRKNCSSDREKLMKFEAESQDFAKILRSLEQSIQPVKGRTIFGNRIPLPGDFSDLLN